jgi:anti-sigma factor RsiW
MTHDDILRQIPEYVLGLLSPRQLSAVEHHAAHCTVCQQSIARERKLGQLVRSTVDVATKPDTAHMRRLMPAIPQQRRPDLILHGWQKQLAPVILILLLILGSFMLNRMLPAGSGPSLVATAHAATATSTYTPTATMAQSLPENQRLNHMSKVKHSGVLDTTVPISSPGSVRPAGTPDPLPTPIATIGRVVAQ